MNFYKELNLKILLFKLKEVFILEDFFFFTFKGIVICLLSAALVFVALFLRIFIERGFIQYITF